MVSSFQKPIQLNCSYSISQAKLIWADNQRKLILPTAPSTIREELDTNPFLRVDSEPIALLVNTKDPILVLKTLRDMKDSFRAS